MKDALENIFGKRGDVTSFVTIVKRLSATSYEVEEDYTKRKATVQVDKDKFYPKGVSVRVQNGRIEGTGRRAGKHKTYEV